MTSEKPRAADTPRIETQDHGLLTPDAGIDPARADYSSSDEPDSNDAALDDDVIGDPARADYSTELNDRQMIIANRSAG